MPSNDFSPVFMPWCWGKLVNQKTDEPSFDKVGVGRFLKDIGLLAIPMSLVAAGFALWMNAKMADVRDMIREAVAAHQGTEIHNFVTRAEWEGAQRVETIRFEALQHENEEQTKQIRKNTMLLERIAMKIGVRREAGD
jgi:hypothetical protein